MAYEMNQLLEAMLENGASDLHIRAAIDELTVLAQDSNLAETVLAMCHLPAEARTGLVAFSLHYPWSQNLEVHSLDGRTVLEPLEPPAAANPNIPSARFPG